MDTPTASPRRRSLLRRLPRILVIDLALLVLVLETLPRLVDIPGLAMRELAPPDLRSEDELRVRPHPYIAYTLREGWRTDPDAKRQATHGAHGFRGLEVPMAKPAGTFRIACLGGSSTYGIAPSGDEATWPHRLQQILTRPGRPVQVLNFGAPGWSTAESLINLQLRGIEYEPDLVLVYHATNDVSPALWPDPVPDNSHFRAVWPVREVSPLEPYLERSVTYLVWRRYFTDYLDGWDDLGARTIVRYDGQYKDPYGDGPFPDRGFENYRRNLKSIVAVARAHGANVAFVTQAFLGRDDDDFVNGTNRRRALDRALAVLRAVAAEHDVPVIDAAPVLEAEAARQEDERGRQRIFARNVHLLDPGAKLLASTIAEGLREAGLVR